MAKSSTTKIVSKKHLARQQREKRQIRIITISSIVILAALFIAVVYGILNETVLKSYKPIVTVNGESVSVREFEIRAKTARQQLIDQFMQYYNLAMMFGIDPNTDSSLANTFNSIQQQLDDPNNLGQQIITNIEDDILIKQYAQANGITVTEEDVENAIKNAYNYYPEGQPTGTATNTPPVYSTLSAEQLNIVTPTSTLEPTSTPTPGSTNTPAPTVAPQPTATPITEQGYQELFQQGLDYYKNLGLNEELFRRVFFESALYRERVKAKITVNVPRESEQVWARHILLPDLSTANSVYTLLMNGGDWARLTSIYSTDTGSKDIGGDLGWFGTGKMVAEFEAVAFDLPIGVISEPVQSQFGYHIIQVIGHENRPLTEDEYNTAVDNTFTTWLEEQRAAADITINANWLTFMPDRPTLQEAFLNLFGTQTAMAPTYEAEQKTSEANLALTPSATPIPATPTP